MILVKGAVHATEHIFFAEGPMASFKPGLGGQAFKWGMHFRQRLMVESVQGAELGGGRGQVGEEGNDKDPQMPF